MPSVFGVTSAATSPAGMIRERRKLVIVGNGGTGKTSLLMVQARGAFPSEYVPTVFENYVSEVFVDKKCIDLALWDTAGQEDYDRLRPLSYPDTDVVVLCYAVNDRQSLDVIGNKWAPEADHFCPGVPKILVALKADLREAPMNGFSPNGSSNVTRMVSTEEGQDMAHRIGAFRFIECSAKNRINTTLVFETAIRSIWDREQRFKKGKRGQIMQRLFTSCFTSTI